MARKKKDEAVTNGPAEPDFAGAAQLIKGTIRPDKEELSKIQGDLSADWKRVQDQYHVHKAAAKDALRVSNMSEESQQDYLRSLTGMFAAFGVALRADLVDQAQAIIPIKHVGPGESELVN